MVESAIPITIYVDNQEIARGYFRRSIAPLTVVKLMDLLPIQGHIFYLGNIAYIIINVRLPPENSTKELKQGSLFYWPMGRGFGVSLKTHTFRYNVNLIGEITEGLENLTKVKRSALIRVDKSE